MVIKFDLFDIPITKSDKKEGTLHYKLKIAILQHLRNKIKNLIAVYYDEVFIETPKREYSYQPDVVIKCKKKQIWVEIETNPWRIYEKTVKLFFLQSLKEKEWPTSIVFCIPQLPPRPNRFKFVAKRLFSLLKIEKKEIYTFEKRKLIKKVLEC